MVNYHLLLMQMCRSDHLVIWDLIESDLIGIVRTEEI